MGLLPRLEFANFVRHPVTAMLIVLLFACSTEFYLLKSSQDQRIKETQAAAALAYAERDKYLRAYILLLEQSSINERINVKKDSLLNNKVVIPAKKSLNHEK